MIATDVIDLDYFLSFLEVLGRFPYEKLYSILAS